MFDLKDYPIPFYKGMMRVVPVLQWQEKRQGKITRHTLIGSHEVNIGNIVPAALWSLLIVGLLLAALAFVARQSGRQAVCLLSGPSGRLSLANTQVALWTVGIGTMVAGYGFLRFEVPDLPESLVALMGLSFATGGISHYRSSRPAANDTVALVAERPVRPRLYHLVSEINSDGAEVLSLPRAQMVFWTVITLILFVVKSMLDGVLWQVPWEMVAFMGMSQLGYLGPKWLPQAPPKTPAEVAAAERTDNQ